MKNSGGKIVDFAVGNSEKSLKENYGMPLSQESRLMVNSYLIVMTFR